MDDIIFGATNEPLCEDFSKIPINCDNKASISLFKNPTLHSGAKHIEIKHHIVRNHVQKGWTYILYPLRH